MLPLKLARALLAATPGTTFAALLSQILTAIETASFAAVVQYLPEIEDLVEEYAVALAAGSPTLAAIVAAIESLLAKIQPTPTV
jgi:hypothetical protein